MKILIANDGSKHAEAALDDLGRAGLPEEGEAMVVSVAEVWLPAPDAESESSESGNPYIERLVREHREKVDKILAEVQTQADQAAARVSDILPKWKVTAKATYGSPAWAILEMAAEQESDLIITGSQGRSAVSRVLLGSISQKVLTEARTSVRVARGSVQTDPSIQRILIGYDGSDGAKAAVEAVAKRDWKAGAEIRLYSAVGPLSPSVIGQFAPMVSSAVEESNSAEIEVLKEKAAAAMEILKGEDRTIDHIIRSGNPKRLLPDAADEWDADAIFVGANSFGSRLERVLIGSTSAAIAARANCSVEVVR